MNNRQKAKHFKKLYETTLPQKAAPIIIQREDYQRHRAEFQIRTRDLVYLQDNQVLMKTHIENGILRGLRPLIWDRLKVEKDIHTDRYIYSLDVWMKKIDEN